MRASYWMWVPASLCLAAAALPVRADDGPLDKAAVSKACPGLAAWEEKHRSAASTSTPDAPPATEPELRAQLLDMAQEDQQVRTDLFGPDKPLPTDDSEGMRRLKAVDEKNLAALYKIVADYGVPGRGLVGADGLNAFWLLIQHAQDLRLQKRVLEAFSIGNTGVPPDEIALLDDRIATAEGRPQKYGTQFQGIGKDMTLFPVEDEAHLDERREKAGLPPIEDYRCVMKLMYGGPQA